MTVQEQPDVSVVIPTQGRPDLLLRAIRSVLAQTLRSVEILVVVDGPDESTESLLDSLSIATMHVVRSEVTLGASEARNLGVRSAAGKWIAFLDDDDEWLPTKLERQLLLAHKTEALGLSPIISTRVIVRGPVGDLIWPRCLPAEGQDVSDYLFGRRGYFAGSGHIQSSALFVSRDLMVRIPFRSLKSCQDVDLVLRLTQEPSSTLLILPEALTIWYIDDHRRRISTNLEAEQKLRWCLESRKRMTSAAISGFLLSAALADAAAAKSVRGVYAACSAAFRVGAPTLRQLLSALCILVFPPSWRRVLRVGREKIRSKLFLTWLAGLLQKEIQSFRNGAGKKGATIQASSKVDSTVRLGISLGRRHTPGR